MKRIFLTLLSLSLSLLLVACSSSEKNGYFGDTRWGMTLNEVNEAVDFLLIETEEDITYSAVDPEGVELPLLEEIKAELSSLHFDFKKDSLKSVRLVLTPKDGTMPELLERVREHFDELYELNEDENESEIWTTDTGTVSVYALNSYLFVDYMAEQEE